MARYNLREFKSKDFITSITNALKEIKEHKNSTLVIDPGVYVLSTELAREAQNNVMNGIYGSCPQPVMFNPKYVYDRGFDFSGHNGTHIEAYGVTILVDGFMEPISIRNCSGIDISGLTIDTVRKPYSRGIVETIDNNNKVTIVFDEKFPITPNMPHMRSAICDDEKFEKCVWLDNMEYCNEAKASFDSGNIIKEDIGKKIYVWHTFHSRPAILIENAKNTHLKDITINSHPGMGITAMHAENISIDRLKVIPANGEVMSTNTDATHFASCRGKLKLENSLFIGMGDDTINCHTYYHDIYSVNGTVITTKTNPSDGTHAQSVDYFEVGDTLQLVNKNSLEELELFTVRAVSYDQETGIVETELDHELVCDDFSDLFIADKDAVPNLSVLNCTMKNHFARGALIKTNKAVIKNCIIQNVFDEAIKIDPESSWREGIATSDILVSGCVMTDCGLNSALSGGVTIYSQCPNNVVNVHKKVVIENCIIKTTKSEHAIFARNVNELILKNLDLSSRGDLIGK